MAVLWPLIIGLFLLLLPLPAFSNDYMMFDLHGNVYPDGQFYVTLHIGERPNTYFLNVDTGSNLTWLECQHKNNPCQHCNRVPHQLYTPKDANVGVRCDKPQCAALREDVGNHNPQRCHIPNPQNHPCHYTIRYADGSSSQGILAKDKFSFERRAEKKDFFFGCGCKQCQLKPSPAKVDGILGLGMGKLSFVKHLMTHRFITKNIIGHCMSIKANRNGYLFIGDYSRHYDPQSLTSVPMTKNEYHYSPGKATLLFHGHQISAHRMTVVFDSGSSYTFMPHRVYHELVSKVKDSVSRSLIEVRDELHQCWKRRNGHPFRSVDEVRAEFKTLALQFDEHHRLDIPPQNYLIVTRKGNVCLGIVSASQVPGLGDLCLIGGVTMQNLLVVYDNENAKIGWKPAHCDTHHIFESTINPRL